MPKEPAPRKAPNDHDVFRTVVFVFILVVEYGIQVLEKPSTSCAWGTINGGDMMSHRSSGGEVKMCFKTRIA
jgi:hypothetical protein